MANPVYEGKMRVFWLPAVASIAAPTTTEITAGTEITEFLPKDGMTHASSKETVDIGNLATAFDPETNGSYGFTTELMIYRDDDGADDAFDLFTTHATDGFLVVLPFKGTGAPAAADVAYVIPANASIATPVGTAPNERQKAEVSIKTTAEPDFGAAVAAGA